MRRKPNTELNPCASQTGVRFGDGGGQGLHPAMRHIVQASASFSGYNDPSSCTAVCCNSAETEEWNMTSVYWRIICREFDRRPEVCRATNWGRTGHSVVGLRTEKSDFGFMFAKPCVLCDCHFLPNKFFELLSLLWSPCIFPGALCSPPYVNAAVVYCSLHALCCMSFYHSSLNYSNGVVLHKAEQLPRFRQWSVSSPSSTSLI